MLRLRCGSSSTSERNQPFLKVPGIHVLKINIDQHPKKKSKIIEFAKSALLNKSKPGICDNERIVEE